MKAQKARFWAGVVRGQKNFTSSLSSLLFYFSTVEKEDDTGELGFPYDSVKGIAFFPLPINLLQM